LAAELAREELSVRGTPVHVWTAGTGDDLLFLHGAGGGGRWLPFQARLAERFTVRFPSHPGHGGAPAAEWIEHISDLAFHYLDMLDVLRVERVHLVGASFGGWIAAEIAVMAGHRLASLTLIDPVGIKVDGWIYPFLFGMDIPEIVQTIFHNPMAALALAPPDQSIETLTHQYRQGAAIARVSWNPYLYNPLLRRRLARITVPTLLCWGTHDRLAPLDPCGRTWAKEIAGARLRVFEGSGHVPHLEEPETVAEAVVEFCGAGEGARGDGGPQLRGPHVQR
jgi:pimeloyl-ACP methyl ester carboxylesterase